MVGLRHHPNKKLNPKKKSENPKPKRPNVSHSNTRVVPNVAVALLEIALAVAAEIALAVALVIALAVVLDEVDFPRGAVSAKIPTNQSDMLRCR